ncbi:hypothetical protein CPB85DRAFT_1302807 [Mucidula mucida]|nr:hypothetical protein CPB85DRAFT_1302807 [Mucidula mucida]
MLGGMHVALFASVLFFLNLTITTSSSLIAYAGKAEGAEPSKTFCLLQTSLLYGYPLMCAHISVLAVLIGAQGVTGSLRARITSQVITLLKVSSYQLRIGADVFIRSDFHSLVDSPSGIHKWTTLLLPYIAWVVTVNATVCVSATDPDNISRNRRSF